MGAPRRTVSVVKIRLRCEESSSKRSWRSGRRLLLLGVGTRRLGLYLRYPRMSKKRTKHKRTCTLLGELSPTYLPLLAFEMVALREAPANMASLSLLYISSSATKHCKIVDMAMPQISLNMLATK